MKKNKHILLYEAFRSKALSKISKYLSKTYNSDHKEWFLSHIRNIIEKLDISIDDVDDKYFDYLSKVDAIDIKSDKVDNEIGAYCYKFWFSVDDGFQGTTFTGVSLSDENYLTLEEVRPLNLNKRTIYPIKDLGDLKNGDKIICYLGRASSISKDRLALGEFFRSELGECYIYQNLLEGSTSVEFHEDNKGYSYCWKIGQNISINAETQKLSLYTEDDKDLSIKMDLKLLNNVSIRSSMRPNVDGRTPSFLDKSDYAIIFYYDDYINDKSIEVKKPSEMRILRASQKKDATALMTENELKNINLQSYFTRIFNNFGMADPIAFNPKNLERVVKKVLNGNLSIFNIMMGHSFRDIDNITSIIIKLYETSKKLNNSEVKLNSSVNKEEIKNFEHYYKIFKERLSKVYFNNTSNGVSLKIKEIKSRLEEINDVDGVVDAKKSLEVLNEYLELSEEISDHLSKITILDYGDLISLKYKISSIDNILNDSDIGLTRKLKAFVDNLRYTDNDSYLFIRMSEEDAEESIEVLKNLRRYLKI